MDADGISAGRRLVLCLDGTWNRAHPPDGAALSNAARIARSVRPAGDGGRQIVFYQEGLGTSGPYDAHIRAYFGWGVTEKIREAYSFLARTWRAGDAIFLFGISRGAFVALTVSRLLGRYGLPAPGSAEPWNSIWPKWLADQDLSGPDWLRPRVRFLGAWDTVEALGTPFPGFRSWTGPQVGPRGQEIGATVEQACHALAYHEQSVAFRPTIWKGPFPSGARVEQRWFRGTHADVCGGFGKPALSDVSLVWMMGRARAAGLDLDEHLLARKPHPEPAAPHSPLRSGTRRFLPVEPRCPGQTSPESETMDEALLRELGQAKRLP